MQRYKLFLSDATGRRITVWLRADDAADAAGKVQTRFPTFTIDHAEHDEFTVMEGWVS